MDGLFEFAIHITDRLVDSDFKFSFHMVRSLDDALDAPKACRGGIWNSSLADPKAHQFDQPANAALKSKYSNRKKERAREGANTHANLRNNGE